MKVSRLQLANQSELAHVSLSYKKFRENEKFRFISAVYRLMKFLLSHCQPFFSDPTYTQIFLCIHRGDVFSSSFFFVRVGSPLVANILPRLIRHSPVGLCARLYYAGRIYSSRIY